MLCYQQLVEKQPAILAYSKSVPSDLDGHFSVRNIPAKSTILEKGSDIENIGILLSGTYRAVDEGKNGEQFVVEKREAVAFIGALACQAGAAKAACRYESITDCEIAFLQTEKFCKWLFGDAHFYKKLNTEYLRKLYSFLNDTWPELCYSSTKYTFYIYILEGVTTEIVDGTPVYILKKTRSEISDETGISVRTITRTVGKFVQDGAVSILHGKIYMSQSQYKKKNHFLEYYKQLYKNGRNSSPV